MKIGKQLALPVLILVAGFGFAVSAQESKPAMKAPAKKARVFFVEPKNGATVTSPLHMKFGSEGIEISPVPPGELTKAQVRPGMAHYHVGIDQSCLTPGKHKLALQLGDDLHDTLPGTCQEITVTVK